MCGGRLSTACLTASAKISKFWFKKMPFGGEKMQKALQIAKKTT
jgi:hypothetical protein